MADRELVFVALGGVGEIGMNLAAYGFGPPRNRRWLVVDVGVTFAGPELPGIDLVYPDVRFLEEERRNIAGIVITHAHEDHIGALLQLWPRLGAPVFASPFSASLLAAKRAGEIVAYELPDIELVRPGERRAIGPFDVEFVAVTHSIPEPMALAIRTPLGTVLHSGDWKLDPDPQVGPPTDLARLAEIGREGVLAFICDSTNAIREGDSPSEADVAKEIAALVRDAPGRVAFTLFASNVARLRSIALAARAADREVVVIGRALRRVIDVGVELGYLADLPPFREPEILSHLPAEHVVLILSGSQGEPRAALMRVADGEDRHATLAPGDIVVFSSRAIPGNERPIIDIINKLVRAGVAVITDRDRLVHVSGHPRRGELAELYRLLTPRIAIPVHGEAVHLAAHAELARTLGVPSVVRAWNGDLVRLAPGPADLIDSIPTGRLYQDGAALGDLEAIGARDRQRLAFAGHVAVAIVISPRGEILADPDFQLTGLPEAVGGRLLEDIVEAAINGAVDSIPRPRRRDPDLVEDAVRRSVRAAVRDAWGKKPVCTVLVTVV
jgi:ribonuclease J